MNNKPTLFVNTICLGKNSSENQSFYDSRKDIKGNVFHRIDDIISFHSLGKKVYIEIYGKHLKLDGFFLYYDKKYIHIKKNDIIQTISVVDVSEIRIIKVL